jgi:hypothetical protein
MILRLGRKWYCCPYKLQDLSACLSAALFFSGAAVLVSASRSFAIKPRLTLLRCMALEYKMLSQVNGLRALLVDSGNTAIVYNVQEIRGHGMNELSLTTTSAIRRFSLKRLVLIITLHRGYTPHLCRQV